ncbi:helix-turn-helix domain-containing protein [Brevibacillus sp. SYSU BS000544]|uniref:helix-turn-helix domain-containing protein n=1 Tax=Brevibacillus sp. SYSU BS000544 TaxID=3416443 RepID=UPI003CE5C384
MDLQAEDKSFLMAITVKGLIPLARERTLQSLYYVLKGRKSNQTYQDVHMYSLFSYYRLFPRLSKEDWQEIVQALQKAQYIELVSFDKGNTKQSFAITMSGMQWQAETEEKYQLQKWLDSSFQSVSQVTETERFWMKLHLMVQTISQLSGNKNSFFPVVSNKEVQLWVKQQLSMPSKREEWLTHLANELYQLLRYLPSQQQRLVVDQFSGISQAGLTLDQISWREKEPHSYTIVKFRHALCRLYQMVQQDLGVSLPHLYSLVDTGKQQRMPISDSAFQTYQLLVKEKDIDTIAKRRNLRRGTIEDHLIEISLNVPQWDHSSFLSQAAKEEIVATSEQYGTKRLRLIREYLRNQYSYLQIRLALALKKENKN